VHELIYVFLLNEMIQDDLISYLKGIIILMNDLIFLIIIIFIFVIIHKLFQPVLINTNYY
jgi:hypothetical protein